MVPARLRELPERPGRDGLRIFTASSLRSRLLGLALLEDLPPDCALLIPACSSIHTFGMRFPIDVAFLDRSGRVVKLRTATPPRRVVHCRGAAGVLEWRSRSASGRS